MFIRPQFAVSNGNGLLLLDTFTDDDFTLVTAHDPDFNLHGNPWVNYNTGDVTAEPFIDINDKLTYNSTVQWPTYPNSVSVIDCEESDVYASVLASASKSDSQVGIVLRASDGDNFWALEFSPGIPQGGTLTIKEVNAGVGTIRATLTRIIETFNEFLIEAWTDGNDIYLSLNGGFQISYTSTFNNTATSHGVYGRCGDNSIDVLDDLSIEVLDTVPYRPGAMYFPQFAYYATSQNVTHSGNAVTVVGTFDVQIQGGGDTTNFMLYYGDTIKFLAFFQLFKNDYPTVELRNKIQVYVADNTGANICLLRSIDEFADETRKSVLFSFDADTGDVVFKVNGVTQDDLTYGGRVATSGTMDVGPTAFISAVGSTAGGAPSTCAIGYFGIDDAYHSDYSVFFDANNDPIDIGDQTGWIFWNENGTLSDNKGTGGNATAFGSITGPQ